MWNLVRATILCVCLSSVLSDECTFNDDCHATTCPGSLEPICEHEEGAGIVINGGLCTCGVTDACSDRYDCLTPDFPELDCTDDRRHCYDGGCICSRRPQFRRGGWIGK